MGRLKEFEQSCLHAADTAEVRLLSLLKDNAETEYGKQHHFADIQSISDYKKNVPLSTFDDYEASVSRMRHGEKNILTAYPISFYAHTSGTVGASKLIPVSDRAERINRDYCSLSSEVYADYLSGKPASMPDRPKILYLLTARESFTPDGTQITNFSGKLCFDRKDALFRQAVKPELIFCNEPMDFQYLFAFYALKETEVIIIAAPFMSAVGDFFCYIEKHWGKLCRDIEEGVLRPDERTSVSLLEHLSEELKPAPERADELRRLFSRGFDHPVASDVWPCLSYVGGIGAASFSSYTIIVQRFIGSIPIYMATYSASEGIFGVSVKMNCPEYLMVPEAGFFEFICEEDMELPEGEIMLRTLGMNELIPGKRYEMVVTNLSGFYRYRIGDVVTVKGYNGQTPVICFSYRRHQILNIAGEKTHEDMIQYSINSLKEQADINIVEWSVCADYSTSPARYLFFLETDPEVEPENREKMQSLLEKGLAEASEYYAHYRQEKKLGSLELIFLQPQTYALYRDIQIWNGASPNQLKPVHVINNPKTEAFFRGLKI